jgi:hypothetical protein
MATSTLGPEIVPENSLLGIFFFFFFFFTAGAVTIMLRLKLNDRQFWCFMSNHYEMASFTKLPSHVNGGGGSMHVNVSIFKWIINFAFE